jgi:EAL domain-containing protein (putative c-di-GMP-specific phosphodiesterase class I)
MRPVPNRLNEIDSVISARNLHGVFQPIVDVANCAVFGHEGLIRGPVNSQMHFPAALFRAASGAGSADALEFIAAKVILGSYGSDRSGRLLFVNFSARAITQMGTHIGRERVANTLLRCDMPARSLVIEITEHERVADHQGLMDAIRFLRGMGVSIALDDFGDGSSSLRLWAELQPEYVKIDRYFCSGIHSDGKKVQTVKAMLRLAEEFGSRVVAEGIEDTADLRVVRDLGISFVQGYVTGRPAKIPCTSIPASALSVLRTRDIAVFPELRRAFHYSPKADKLLIAAPAVTAAVTNQEILQLFKENPQLHAVAVLHDDQPVGRPRTNGI